MKEFSKLRTEAYGDMVGRKQKLLNRSNDAYKQGDLPTMRKAHSLAMKQDARTVKKYPDESRKSTMSGATKDYADREKKLGPGKVRDSVEYSDDTNVIGEGERGLWDNIHAKRKRIKAGSGERMRKPGSKGAPTAKALRVSAEAVEIDEGIMDFMSNTPAKPKSKLSLSAMRDISRKMDTKNKMPKVSRASNDFENTNAHLRLVRAEEKDDVPFDGPYKSSFKKPNNPNRTGMDSARALAKRSMDQANKKEPVQDLARARKVNMGEEKEKTEYDYEGDMARGQLQSIISNAQRVHDMLEDNTNIAEWVQSKITLAEDYISTVANYMMSEIDEAKTDESRQVYYINSHKNQDPAVAQAKRLKNKMSKPKMLNLKMGESYSARNRLVMALDKEKKKREDHEAAQAAREAAAKQPNPPEEKIKEGIASLISKNIKRVTATKPTPQQKADIRLNK